MSAGDENDSIDDALEAAEDALEEFVNQVAADMRSKGHSEVFIEQFLCMRFHVAHPWGVGFVMFGDKKLPAVVRHAGPQTVQVCFVAYDPSMKLLDIYGNPLTDEGMAINTAQAGADRKLN